MQTYGFIACTVLFGVCQVTTLNKGLALYDIVVFLPLYSQPSCITVLSENIAIAMVAEHEFALVVGAPQFIRLAGVAKGHALSSITPPLTATDQAIAVKHCVNSALGRRLDLGKLTQ